MDATFKTNRHGCPLVYEKSMDSENKTTHTSTSLLQIERRVSFGFAFKDLAFLHAKIYYYFTWEISQEIISRQSYLSFYFNLQRFKSKAKILTWANIRRPTFFRLILFNALNNKTMKIYPFRCILSFSFTFVLINTYYFFIISSYFFSNMLIPTVFPHVIFLSFLIFF